MESSSTDLPLVLNQLETKQSILAKTLSILKQENQKLQLELTTIQQQQIDLNASLRPLAQQQNNGDDDWTLAEIEYLLIIAIHRLQLEGDVNMALAAMQAADDRLKDDDDLRLLPIRQQLANDMNALKAVNKVDTTGLVLFLSDLAGRVAELPLQQVTVDADVKQESVAVEKKDSKWKQLKSSVWQELKGLVIITRRGNETLATLMPEQQYFLYQNLRLQLESARYAVLRRDTENLQVSLGIISSWLNRYFDSGDNSVANILDAPSQMQGLELKPPLPDISAALETLRTFMGTRAVSLTIIQEEPEPAAGVLPSESGQ
jgi:uroporphyrin-3 C-methyltransferase